MHVQFAGSPERIEARLVAEAGYEFHALHTSGLPRRPSWSAVRALGGAVQAPVKAARILRATRPGVVMGGGGYVGGPVVMAARMLGIPAAFTEADAHLGLANRLAAPFAQAGFLAYPVAGRAGSKYRVVGRPIPQRSVASLDRGEARRRFGLPEEGDVVLIVGGSLGARALNRAVVDAFGRGGPSVLHLCGERDYAELAPLLERADYRLIAFTDEFGAALRACDLVVSRSGGVVWEIAAAGVPALLVPYPHATADHQYKNAVHFVEGGAAHVVRERELQLGEQVARLLAEKERLRNMGAAMLELARPDAADDVAEGLILLGSVGK